MLRTSLLLSSALAFAGSLTAQRVAEIEPNDTVAQAQTLVAGSQVTANLAAGDQDWFQFTLAGPAQVHLRTTGNFTVNPSVDTVVFLFDAAGTTRLAWNDNASGLLSDLGATLPAGSYTVQVVGKTGTTAGDYGLDFVVLPALTIQTVEGPEPNGDPALGGVPTPITLGDTVEGALASPTDIDWYTFTVTTRSVVQAICYDDGGVPQLDNTLLSFFQEVNPGVYTAFGTTSTLATGHRAFTLAHPTTLSPGNYAIQVAAGTAAVGTAPFNYTKTGKYALRTRLMAMPGTAVVGEGVEPNNSIANAPAFQLGDTLTGFCSGSNEEDWWMFTVAGPTTIVAMCDGGLPSPTTNQDLRLYDLSGTLLSTATSGGPGSHGRLIYTLPQAGVYFLSPYGGAFAATGDYVVYTGSSDAMFVSAAWNAQPPSTNACPGSNGLRPALTVASTEVPMVGSTFVVRLQNTLPNAIAVPIFGFSRETASGGTIPLPYDLTPAEPNAFNKCMVRVDPLMSAFLLTDAAGVGWIEYRFPATQAVRGLPFFMQTMLLDLPNNPLGVSMSNDARMLVGERSY
jgi:hypothetical protein